MTRKLLPTLLLTLATSALAAPTTAPDAAYEIKFERPVKVGQSFDLHQTIEIAQTITTKVAGKENDRQVQKTKITLDGTLEVLAVDDKGRQTKIRVTITKLQGADNDQAPTDLVTDPVTLEGVYADNQINWTQTKGALPQQAQQLLAGFFPPRNPENKITNDDILGSPTKRKPGETWPINLKLVAASMGLDPDKATGNVKLDSAKNIKGEPWLHFTETIESPAQANDTNLGQAKSAKFTITGLESMPADITNPSSDTEGARTLTAIFEGKTPDGAKSTITAERTEKHATRQLLTTPPATAPSTQK